MHGNLGFANQSGALERGEVGGIADMIGVERNDVSALMEMPGDIVGVIVCNADPGAHGALAHVLPIHIELIPGIGAGFDDGLSGAVREFKELPGVEVMVMGLARLIDPYPLAQILSDNRPTMAGTPAPWMASAAIDAGGPYIC